MFSRSLSVGVDLIHFLIKRNQNLAMTFSSLHFIVVCIPFMTLVPFASLLPFTFFMHILMTMTIRFLYYVHHFTRWANLFRIFSTYSMSFQNYITSSLTDTTTIMTSTFSCLPCTPCNQRVIFSHAAGTQHVIELTDITLLT